MPSYKIIFATLLFTAANCGISSLDNASTHLTFPTPNDSWQNSLYFNTSFLTQYDLVAQTLISQEGFVSCNFKTEDNITINGLWKQKHNAQATIIFCAGFYPGRKESMASFIHLVPSDCSLLFIDARGHGKSEGAFVCNLHNYGKDEYKDVIAAIQFIRTQSQTPIYILGICAGAFHAARALIELGPQSISHNNIKGLVFDSGITSLVDAMNVPTLHFKEKMLPTLLQGIYSCDEKKEIKERLIYKACAFIATNCLSLVAFCMKPFIKNREDQSNLLNSINTVSCPILYIHAMNDTYCPCAAVQELANKTQKSACWFIEKSEHALNQFKYKEEYKNQLHSFIQTYIPTAR